MYRMFLSDARFVKYILYDFNFIFSFLYVYEENIYIGSLCTWLFDTKWLIFYTLQYILKTQVYPLMHGIVQQNMEQTKINTWYGGHCDFVCDFARSLLISFLEPLSIIY